MSACALRNKRNNFYPNELNEVVISDSKFALAKEKSGKVIVKITSEELSKKSGQSLAAILSMAVPVLKLTETRVVQVKNTTLGRNRQTLILIDGIPVTDASGINLV
jgi:vitamin B12 transporter